MLALKQLVKRLETVSFFPGVFGVDYFVGLFYHFEDFGIGNVSAEIELYPIFGTHVAQALAGVAGFEQFSDAFLCVLYYRVSEIVHIHHAEHMVAYIENKHRVKSRRELPEGRFLRDPIK